MSEPQPAMDQAEQSRLTRSVGRALLKVAPAGWTEIRAEYRCAGRHIEVDVFVSGPDRVPHAVRPPMEVVEGLGRLRHGMYHPGRGTWLSAVYLLEPPSTFSAEFEPDAEPRWRRPPPPIGFQDELRFFPRIDDHIPPWLRLRAGLPPLIPPDQPAGSTPPAGLTQPPPPAPAPTTPPGGFGPPPAAVPPQSPTGAPRHQPPARTTPAGADRPAIPPTGQPRANRTPPAGPPTR